MQKVLIVVGESYIGQGVESLLSRESDLRVDSTHFLDEGSLSVQIDHYCPNVVILDDSLLSSELINLANLLTGYPKIRVLVLSILDNRMSVYDRKEVIVSKSLDLVTEIRQT